MGIGSQIDGLGQLGENHVYKNAIHTRDFVTPKGLTRFSIHELPPIVTRGILLDMTKLLGMNPLPKGTAINHPEIERAAKTTNAEIESGDVV